MSKFTKQYQEFFMQSDAGSDFTETISNMILSKHEMAENTPENARDFAQQAKGIREVEKLIQSITANKKKGSSSRSPKS